MAKALTWLTVLFDENIPIWPTNLAHLKVLIDSSAPTIQNDFRKGSFRTSPIFPLRPDFILPELESYSIYFYCFKSAFTALGRLSEKGSDQLQRRLWYTFGLASVVLITADPKFDKELRKIVSVTPFATETWAIDHSNVIKVDQHCECKPDYDPTLLLLPDYSHLPTEERAIVDEVSANISLIAHKTSIHIRSEFESVIRLVTQMKELVTDIIFLNTLTGPVPAELNEYSIEKLKGDPQLRQRTKHQAIDRLIQVNSALSYVTTQLLSGAVPILERRSLIRRHSLLGIGSASLALHKIVRTVQTNFSRYSLEEIIKDRMADAPPLSGIDRLPRYDCSKWSDEKYSLAHFEEKVKQAEWYPKWPYFSGRLGFRETEYSISAALQSLSSGAHIAWNIQTLTHELMHGHFRDIISLVFQGEKDQAVEKWHDFYNTYVNLVDRRIVPSTELECIRSIIFTYCSNTYTNGSITNELDRVLRSIPIPQGTIKEISDGFYLLTFERLRRQFAREYRGISEIFAHILDLYYFYGSKLTAYIPLIWRSWAEVPHVNGDLRQYVLRSLLAIASKEYNPNPLDRFNLCLDRFREIIEEHIDGALNGPLIHDLKKQLAEEVFLRRLDRPFTASLILVDLIRNVFFSRRIRAGLFKDDPHISVVENPVAFESTYEYNMPESFSQEAVEQPIAYLLDRMQRQLKTPLSDFQTEAVTARLFLACCSMPIREGG